MKRGGKMRKETADFYFYFCVWIFLQANGFFKKLDFYVLLKHFPYNQNTEMKDPLDQKKVS